MENATLKTALFYKQVLGLNVLPITIKFNEVKRKNEKKPIVKWTELQSRMVTDQEIVQWWTQYPDAGIGAVVGGISGIVVIDCDSQKAIDELESELPDNIVIPCVNTVSGGRHYYFSTDKQYAKKVRFFSDMDLQAENSLISLPPTKSPKGATYEWVAAQPQSRHDFASINIINNKSTLYRELQKLCKDDVRSTPLQNITNLTSAYIGNIWENGKRDDNLYHVTHDLRLCRNSEDYIRQVLRAIIFSWGERDEKWINDKIQSVLNREDRQNRNLMQELKEHILIQKSLREPYILLTETFQTLQLLTKEQKNNAYVAISRICAEQNLIKKQEDKRGVYRILYNEKDSAKMDLESDPEIQEVNVKLPIQLNDMCVLSPGNIIVVAGSKSSGKTAMLLNIAHLNQYNFDVVYLNSEMHETEFKKRIKKLAPLKDWKIEGFKCHNNFDDYITGESNKIYIVDYLEIHKDFYDIATPIRKIHEKLGDSVCFVAIQMKAGAELGRGGDFSAEKSRLYLTMDYNDAQKKTKVTIYDAKEPKPPHDNVRGQWRMIKIRNGAELSYSPQDNWKW